MPGAGSLKVVNYLFNAAPRDGTVMATFARGVVYEPLLGHPEARIRGAEFQLDRQHRQRGERCAFNAQRGIATWQDMTATKTLIGASGTGADSDVFPTVLRNLFGLPMRIVTGYPGGADLVLAMERGEIDGRCGWSWTSLLARNRDMLSGKRITVPLQIALERHEDLADVPTIMELPDDPRRAGGAQAHRVPAGDGAPVRGAAGSCAGSDRGAAQQPSMPPWRTPIFSPRCAALALEVRPVTGTAVQSLMANIHASPPDVLALARELLAETPDAARAAGTQTMKERTARQRTARRAPRRRLARGRALGYLATMPSTSSASSP